MIKNITFAILVLLFAGCSGDDNTVDTTPTELEGRWTLVSASCFCFFDENTDFSQHKVRFTGSNLEVINTGQIEFLNSSGGAFSIAGDVLTFNDGSKYTFELKGGTTLKLIFVDNPDVADDELTLNYTKG